MTQESLMKLYKYKAVSKTGRPITGILSANDQLHLNKQLEATGSTLIKCSVVKKRGGFKLFAKKVRLRDILQLYIQLEQMQKAGIALLDALDHCRESIANPELRDTVSEIYRLVSEGMSLSEAFGQFPNYFSKLEISIIGASERTGDMVSSYKYLVDYLKAADEMQRRLRKATRYPMILISVILLSVVILMGFVVPEIIGFIANMKAGDLPFATTSLMATSDFFQKYWWLCIGGLVGSIVLFFSMRKLSSGFRYESDKAFIKSPVIGDLLRKIEISRFSYIVSALYKAGVPFMECLSVAREVVGNQVIAGALQHVHEQMHAGGALSEAMNDTGEFPSIVIQMIRIGEESGNMNQVLDQVSEFYDHDVEEAMDGMITMIEPLLTAIMSFLIIWIAVAVFGPIYDMFGEMEF